MAGIALQTSGLERQIAVKDAEVKRIETRLAQIDKNIDTFLNSDKATAGLRASNSLKGERDKLQKTLDERNIEINALNEKLTPLKQQGSEVEAKLGPIKYVAALFGMTDPESAVRIVIIMIMLVFDPLAIVLMISGLISISQRKGRSMPGTPSDQVTQTMDLVTSDSPVMIVDAAEPAEPELTDESEAVEASEEPAGVVAPQEAVSESEAAAASDESKFVAVDDGNSRVLYPLPQEETAIEAAFGDVVLDPQDVKAAQEVIAAFQQPARATEQYEVVGDEVQPVLDADQEDASLLLELERDRDPVEEATPELTHETTNIDQREKLIRLLEENPDFLLEVANAITDIQREQQEKINSMIHGGGASQTEVKKLGADFQ